MCTAFRFNHLFGRTLDLEYDLGQGILKSCEGDILGIGIRHGGTELFFDGVNKHGLAGAALNFEGCACYSCLKDGKQGLASYEVLPHVLKSCRTAMEACELIRGINIISKDISPELKSTPLHFAFADRECSVVAEQTAGGMTVEVNPVDVLTNSPEFSYQMLNLANYMHLSARPPESLIYPGAPLSPYCRGMGAIGMPGDNSSASRFVRAVFNLKNAEALEDKQENLGQFFHICDSVSQIKGCNVLENGKQVYTVYAVCYDLDDISCSLTRYNQRCISTVHFDDPIPLLLHPL